VRAGLVLLADTVYPLKDSAPLLSALRALVLPPICADLIVAVTVRDQLVHGAFEDGLFKLPARVERIGTDATEADPVCGKSSTVHLYRASARPQVQPVRLDVDEH